MITFEDFELEAKSEDDECYDKFEIYDTRINYDTLIATFCGRDLHDQTLVTDIDDIHLVFRTDGMKQKKGFRAEVSFTFIEPQVPSQKLLLKSIYSELKSQYRFSLLHSISLGLKFNAEIYCNFMKTQNLVSTGSRTLEGFPMVQLIASFWSVKLETFSILNSVCPSNTRATRPSPV